MARFRTVDIDDPGPSYTVVTEETVHEVDDSI